jgi:outer membrane receptor protein involved in Fe transport
MELRDPREAHISSDFLKPFNASDHETALYELWEKSGYFNPDNLPGNRAEMFSIIMPPPNANGSLHAATFNKKLSGVFGVFLFGQKLRADGFHQEEAGTDTWRFVQSSRSALWKTPGLLEGYGLKSYPSLDNFSGAVFAQVDWEIFKGFRILPGLRLNYDKKSVDYQNQAIADLKKADTLIISTPIWNFGIPAVLKAWFDQIIAKDQTVNIKSKYVFE